jgi:peptide/nickel transport system substrate-binding protein
VAAAAFGAEAAGDTVAVSTADPIHLDVQVTAPGNVPQAFANYDYLVALDAKGGYKPYLATSWVQTPSTITFTLRKGVVCQDGHALTANTVLASFKRLIEVPKEVNAVPQDFGPGPYSISANPKANTFTLRVGTPYSALLAGFAEQPILCSSALAALQQDPKALQQQTYGSGPYKLVTWTKGDRIVDQLYDKWTWGPFGKTAAKLPKNLIYRVVPNATTAANLLLTGELDWAQITGPDIDRLKSSKLALTTFPIYWPSTLVFNQAPGKLTADPILREAISMTIDQNDWNQAACLGLCKPATGIILPGERCYDPAVAKLLPVGGVDKAKALLQSHGYTYKGSQLTSPKGDPVSLRVRTSPIFASGPDYLAAQLTKLGVDVDLQNVATQYGLGILRQDFDVATALTTNLSREPLVLQIYLYGATPAQGGLNIFGPPNDAKLNRMYHEAARTVGAVNCKWWKDIQEYTAKNILNFPLAVQINYNFHNPKLTDVLGPRGFMPATMTLSK